MGHAHGGEICQPPSVKVFLWYVNHAKAFLFNVGLHQGNQNKIHIYIIYSHIVTYIHIYITYSQQNLAQPYEHFDRLLCVDKICLKVRFYYKI